MGARIMSGSNADAAGGPIDGATKRARRGKRTPRTKPRGNASLHLSLPEVTKRRIRAWAAANDTDASGAVAMWAKIMCRGMRLVTLDGDGRELDALADDAA